MLVDNLSKVLLNPLEGLLLSIALIDKLFLFFDEDCRWMCNVHEATMGNVDAGCLREVLGLWVLAIEVREKLHVTGSIVNFLRSFAWVAYEGVRREDLLDFITHRLRFEASFKPHPHFL